MNKRIPVCIALLTFIASSPAGAFNSEEHKSLVDRGVSKAYSKLATTLSGSGIRMGNPATYERFLARAKAFANGANSKSTSQDNCYYHSYAQSKYNESIFIPPKEQIPRHILQIPGVVRSSGSPDYFSLGELSALYGDYRRVTYCLGGSCMLTNADVSTIEFVPPLIPTGNRLLMVRGYCPKPLGAGTYLRMIASGVVPPHGKLGNATGNSARDTQYNNAGWWGDEMMRIATTNDWHFSEAAVAWYIGMHRLALHASVKAFNNPKYWVRALHYEASALHALVDLFSLGHVVVDRSINVEDIVNANSLLGDPSYRWMKAVMALGGGKRSNGKLIKLHSTLPTLTEPYHQKKRIDFLPAGAGKNPLFARKAMKHEEQHTAYNKAGGIVFNARGSAFVIYGDGKLEKTDPKIPIAAVEASILSLVESHNKLKRNPRDLNAMSKSSAFLRALGYVPIYVQADYLGRVKGRYARYANAVYTHLRRPLPASLKSKGCLVATDYPPEKKATKSCAPIPPTLR